MCMYGGPRKFQTIYDDHLKRIDEGVGEGLKVFEEKKEYELFNFEN